ncbi:MAG: HAD family phosphatase [Candidatus Peribacteraceae bacterium]|nr:HAD family phosphatase [Candidatus Peribacteraceae bacterium]
MQPAAFLFDLDGTLIDSLPLYEEAYLSAFAAHDLPLDIETFRRDIYCKGLPLKSALAPHKATHLNNSIRAGRDAHYEHLLATKLRWFPDVLPLLEALPPSIPRAIVTGSHRSYVKAIERCLPLSKYFPTIITADEMDPYFKPHPHGLFLAAQALGAEPQHCVYIGDQVFDMEAARNAKMANILIAREFTPSYARDHADRVITSLGELA